MGKVLQFKQPAVDIDTSFDAHDQERMERIRASLEKINRLMADLRQRSKENV